MCDESGTSPREYEPNLSIKRVYLWLNNHLRINTNISREDSIFCNRQREDTPIIGNENTYHSKTEEKSTWHT